MKFSSLFKLRRWLMFYLNSPCSRALSDKAYLKLRYYASTGKKLRLKKPQTYNEKLQWLKLHDRRPEYTEMVDKYAVKEYVANLIGKEYVIPTLDVWDRFDDIDFDALPDKFVLKCTHDSGGLVICRDKATFNKEAARAKIEKCLKRDFYFHGREWPYKNVPHRIIAEEYMEDSETKELRDYKFFCFGGTPRMLFIATERMNKNEETKFDFFDMDFNHLDVRNGHPNADVPPKAPQNFEEMKNLAAKLSQNIPHVRVDFYEVNGKTYFGELTFFHWSGLMPFDPPKWDKIMGDWITLPTGNS